MEAVSGDTFATDVLQSKKTVLVDFWAEWCGPCRAVGPMLKEMEPLHPEVSFLTLDTDVHHKIAQDYAVMNLPTILVFKDGVLKDRITGALPKDRFVAMVENAIA